MWTRLRFELSRGAWAVLRGIGTRDVSVPLAAVAAAFAIAEPVVRGANDGRWSIVETWPWWAVVWAAVVDSATGVLRALPYRQREDGRLEWRPIAASAVPGLAWRSAWLLASLALLLSSGWRDRMEFRVAQGEVFTASPEQLVARDPVRLGSRGPFALDLAVERVDGGPWAPGAPLRAVLRSAGGTPRTIGRTFPAWFGWGRYLRVSAVGPTLRCDVGGPVGSGLDGVQAKLDLFGAPPQTEIRFERAPLRLLVRSIAGEPLVPGRPPALAAAVYRGKLLVGEGGMREGAPLDVEGLRISCPAWTPWVQLELVRDPGVPLAGASALAVLVAIGAEFAVRARRRGPPRGADGSA